MFDADSGTVTQATTDDLRRRNLAGLLGLLHINGAMTRSSIAGALGVNRSTVAALVAELASEGMVREDSGTGGSVGRPSLVVEPVSTSAAVIAFDMRVERIVGSLVGVGGQVLATRERRPQGHGLTPTEAVRILAVLAGQLHGEHPDIPVVGVGVAVHGLVRKVDGMVSLAPNLGWRDVPLGNLLSDALAANFAAPLPVAVGNDADLGVTSEHRRGSAAGTHNVVFLSGEVGIGGGVVIDGRVMAGGLGFGGEVGHMVVNPRGRSCRCGSQGCWETEIGREAVLGAVGLKELIGDVPDLRPLVLESDAAARRVEDVGEWLGIGLKNLVNIFNPEVIILGGHLRPLHQASACVVERQLTQALPASRRDVRLVYPHFERRAALMGAAETAFDRLLHDPISVMSRAARAS